MFMEPVHKTVASFTEARTDAGPTDGGEELHVRIQCDGGVDHVDVEITWISNSGALGATRLTGV